MYCAIVFMLVHIQFCITLFNSCMVLYSLHITCDFNRKHFWAGLREPAKDGEIPRYWQRKKAITTSQPEKTRRGCSLLLDSSECCGHGRLAQTCPVRSLAISRGMQPLPTTVWQRSSREEITEIPSHSPILLLPPWANPNQKPEGKGTPHQPPSNKSRTEKGYRGAITEQ